MIQLLRIVAIAEMQQQRSDQQPINWIRLIDFVELAINNAALVITEAVLFYINLGYHPTFIFDVLELP